MFISPCALKKEAFLQTHFLFCQPAPPFILTTTVMQRIHKKCSRNEFSVAYFTSPPGYPAGIPAQHSKTQLLVAFLKSAHPADSPISVTSIINFPVTSAWNLRRTFASSWFLLSADQLPSPTGTPFAIFITLLQPHPFPKQPYWLSSHFLFSHLNCQNVLLMSLPTSNAPLAPTILYFALPPANLPNE